MRNTAWRIVLAVLLLPLAPAGCDDPLGGAYNQAPVANAGPDRTVVDEEAKGNAAVELSGALSVDPDGEIVAWSWTEGDSELASVASPTLELAVGTHVLTLTVTDDGGATASDQVTIRVEPRPRTRTAPVATILSPADGASFVVGSRITFVGSAKDAEDGAFPDDRMVWTAGYEEFPAYLPGTIALGLGPSIGVDDLLPGRNRITLTVRDSDGQSGRADIYVTIAPDPRVNEPPMVVIVSPQSGTDRTVPFGLIGMAYDPEEGQLMGDRLTWDLDGERVGEGGMSSLVVDPEPGPHVLTLTATDSRGATGTADLAITLLPFVASFEDDVLPFFVRACTDCHGAERAEGGVRLDSYAAIFGGGNANGPLIVPGDPARGILIPQILSDHRVVEGHGVPGNRFMGLTVMPSWIEQGAPRN